MHDYRPSGILRVDASYKICKLIKVKLETKAAACCYTMMTGDGVIVGCWLLPEESHACLKKPMYVISLPFELLKIWKGVYAYSVSERPILTLPCSSPPTPLSRSWPTVKASESVSSNLVALLHSSTQISVVKSAHFGKKLLVM